MDDNTHPLLMRVTVLSLGLGACVALWRERWRARQGLRLIGLWSYLVVVNGGLPEMKLVLEAERASDGDEMVRPYWGYEAPRVAAQRLLKAATKPLSEPTAAITGRSTGRTA
ncbi:MAG: hypothetical protein J4N98_03170 [Chloroflexi bacterium]|nr:hypothetical protein [Chloroflexota bacterium]